jgi:hypothetical protein
MPRWWWVCDATPRSRVSAIAGDAETSPQVVLPGADETVRFEDHVKRLFRERDRQSMKFAFDLWSYDDVRAAAARTSRPPIKRNRCPLRTDSSPGFSLGLLEEAEDSQLGCTRYEDLAVRDERHAELVPFVQGISRAGLV